MKNRILLFIVATLIVSPLIGQNKILFMTDMPRNEQPQIIWLQDQGFDVTIDSLSNLNLSSVTTGMWDTINSYDLVIAGRLANSSEFDAPDDRYWNALRVPLIINSAYAARSSRIKFFNSTSIGNIHNLLPYNKAVIAVNPSDAIWSDVTLTNDSVPFYNSIIDYLNVDMNTVSNNGERVAEIATPGGFVPIITRWTPGTQYYDDPDNPDFEGGNITVGHKTYFGIGCDHYNNLDPEASRYLSSFNISDEGKKVYLAEINRMLALADPPPTTEARLFSLSTSVGILSPAFDKDVTSYTLLVP
ncbi:MAG: hypothetical protein P1P82_17770, partial [Bacteroidales bacterium]|nr:hypothetical protein [Bacteroidales bacterium]